MRKYLLIFALIMSIFFTAQAGYITRGFQMSVGTDLKNYTLSFDGSGDPIAAGTMHTASAPNGKNSIVIIAAHNLLATVFPIPYSGSLPMLYDIEVRDFHRVSEDMYVLCGSRQINSTVSAFVAVITHNFTAMQFYEYQEASVFYSICVHPSISSYYVCGSKDKKGVIVAIDKVSMQVSYFHITYEDWEYHKIIAKGDTDIMLRFIASGKDPGTRIGFTIVDPSFNTTNSYLWTQQTEPNSHCVVSDYIGVDNTVILASSNENIVTLNPVTFPLFSPTMINTYRFLLPAAVNTNIYLQDIGTILSDPDNLRISVAGYVRTDSQIRAWHGYTEGGLSATSTLTNNYYGDTNKQYEHYKIRYDQNNEYTGGYFYGDNSMCALFGTPLTLSLCDDLITVLVSPLVYLNWIQFNLWQIPNTLHTLSTASSHSEFTVDYVCDDFKSAPAPEYSMPSPETESDIIAFQDRITLKDIPSNTNYQIYSVIGQLIQTGTTASDISTAQLGKGVYILRLENGKTFKFVK